MLKTRLFTTRYKIDKSHSSKTANITLNSIWNVKLGLTSEVLWKIVTQCKCDCHVE